MTISIEAINVRFDAERMWVTLDESRVVGVPLSWYPRLVAGSVSDREKAWISPSGIHWDELNEDISIEGILAGRHSGGVAYAA